MKPPRLGPGSTIVVDREVADARIVSRWLDRAGHTVSTVSTPAECLEAVEQSVPDLIVLSLDPRDDSGLELLRTVRVRHPRIASVVLTENAQVPSVVAAMQAGARDYLVKPLEEPRLLTAAKNAISYQRLNSRVTALEQQAKGEGFGGIVGRSPAMKGLFGQLERLAESDITVLVHGESGAGKELVARAVHENSQRRKGPFVAVNCAAIPDSLQESELFGHEKGAFTGALERRVGRFEQASGGTLFFDEIGELTPTLQAKLLRVLQERAFHRVGGLAELTTDVRILAATNRNLADEVTAGRFREDLYYRVAVMELHVPPLRAREGDIALLAQMFLEEFDELSGRYAEPRGFEIDALQCLLAYSWPGNVRELQNAMQRASVLADAALVRITDLPATVQRAGTATRLPGDTSQGTGAPAEAEASPIPDMAREAARVHDSEIAVEIQPREPAPDERSVFYSPSYPVVAGPPATVHIPQGTTLAELEEAAVRSAMSRFAANISAAARELGISRSVLYRKLDRYGLRGTQESDGTADSEDVSGSSGGSA